MKRSFMNTQNDLIRNITAHIAPRHWLSLGTGVFVGIITHLYMLTNKLPNWDDLNNLYGSGSGALYGRWLLEYIHDWAGHWSVPALNGMLAILFMSVSACLILDALELRSVTSAILLPMVVVTFPSLACVMTFMFMADLYTLGFLTNCVAAWLIRKYRWGFVPGAILMMLGLSIYQSLICAAAGILVLGLAIELFRGEELKKIWRKGLVSLGSLMVALGSYVVITKFVVGGLGDNKGISSMGEISLLQLPRLIGRAYLRTLEFFVTKPWGFVSDFGKTVNLLVIAAIFLLFFYLLYRKGIFKDIPRLIFLCVMMLLVPLALAAVYIMAPDAGGTLLTLYQYFLIYGTLLGLWELWMETEPLFAAGNTSAVLWAKRVLAGFACILVFFVAHDNFVLTHNTYFRMSIAYERIHSFYERLYYRIEEQEGYKLGDPIAILGDWWPERNILSSHEIDIGRYDSMEGVAMENGLFTTGVRRNFLRIYLGIDYEEVGGVTMQELMKTEEFRNMPDYPAEGCVQRIDGIWVIRVAD